MIKSEILEYDVVNKPWKSFKILTVQEKYNFHFYHRNITSSILLRTIKRFFLSYRAPNIYKKKIYIKSILKM